MEINNTRKIFLFLTYFCRAGELGALVAVALVTVALVTVALVTVALAAVQLVTVALGVVLGLPVHTGTSSSIPKAGGDSSPSIGIGEVCISSIGGADGYTSMADGCG